MQNNTSEVPNPLPNLPPLGGWDPVVSKLETLSLKDLCEQYELWFSKPAPPWNKSFLLRKIIYRMQESQLEPSSPNLDSLITNILIQSGFDQDGKKLSKRSACTHLLPGSRLRRQYKGKVHEISVLQKGFEYKGEIYSSLSVVAEKITGAHWNGRLFFGLSERKKK